MTSSADRLLYRGCQRALVAFACSTSVLYGVHADTFSTVSAAKIGTAALIHPTNADAAIPSITTSTTTAGFPVRAKQVEALAQALVDTDTTPGDQIETADRIYDFVRNYVETSFMFGLQKGAVGAIIDRSGTPFDQAHLMVELLRATGYTASYKFGTITLTGTQFAAWTHINDPRAACELLASGGIPAEINGSGNVLCSAFTAGTTLTSVKMAHVWVRVTINGITFAFDPSYKEHTFTAGVNLATVAALTAGQTITQATAGMGSGTASGVGYVVGLNQTALSTTLTTYATNLLNHVQTNLPTARLEDLVGGAEIQRFELAPAGQTPLRQTALPYLTSVDRTWTGGIPDQFRTSLHIQVERADRLGGTPIEIINKTLYADELYGRRLTLAGTHPPDGSETTVTLTAKDVTGEGPTLFDQTFVYAPVTQFALHNAGYNVGNITLTVDHPYPAAASGAATATQDYMDVAVIKNARYFTPLTIVHGWGDTGKSLVDAWGTRLDGTMQPILQEACETCQLQYVGSDGGGRREQLAATWLAQSSRAAWLHAQIAGSVYMHHHSVGLVAADEALQTIDITGGTTSPVYRFTNGNSYDRADIDTGFSVTSRTGDSATRNAAVHAIAETLEALEGSIHAQSSDLPDTTSTATRFEWGNKPPLSEDAVGGAVPRRFYAFDATNQQLVGGLAKVEGQFNSPNADFIHGPDAVEIDSSEYGSRKGKLASAVAAYTAEGFGVVTSEEAFLGPGQRGGLFKEAVWNENGYPIAFSHAESKQRGGAFVATRYDAAGAPFEIAHLAVGPDGPAKGGGGGTQKDHQERYDPSAAADILKSRFVDRSRAMGVDLLTGNVTVTSPASLSVGSGGFPYELSANLVWVGGNRKTDAFGPLSHSEPQTPWTTNWNNTLTVSGSGMEMLGEGDIRATTGTVAAFLAAQDIYKAASSIQREVAGALIGAWWVRQLTGNVVTVNVGTQTRQFVKLFNGNWIASGSDSYAALTESGSRSVYEDHSCETGVVSYVQTRGWNYAGVSYTVKNAQGDTQLFPYWDYMFAGDTGEYCAKLHGFRLTNWHFPQGVDVNLTYSNPASGTVGVVPELLEVTNTLGRKLTFIESGLGGFTNGLTGSDLRQVTVTSGGPSNGPITYTHTEPTGAVTRYTVDLVGDYAFDKYLVREMYDASNATVPALEYTYDAMRRVKEAKDAVALQQGTRGPYTYLIGEGASGARIDPDGGRYSVIYDADRRPLRVVDEIKRMTSVSHDGRGRVLSYTFPEGHRFPALGQIQFCGDQELFEYDDRNNATKLTKIAKFDLNCQPTPAANLVVSASWNTTWNKPDWIRDARGNAASPTYRTDFTYFGSGNGQSLLKDATRPLPRDGNPLDNPAGQRPKYAFTYNNRGQVLTTTDPTGVVTQNTYAAVSGSASELVSSRLDPTGINATTGFGYDALGNQITVTDPRSYVTETAFDVNRRPTVTKSHDGSIAATLKAASETIYNLLGQVTTKRVATAVTGTTVTAWQNVETYTYTPTGKLATQANGAGDTTLFSYDDLDRQVMVTDPVGRRVATVSDPASQTSCIWKAWDSPIPPDSSNLQVCDWTNPPGYSGNGKVRYAAYTYTGDGLQERVTDAGNNRTTYTYDGFNRLIQLNFPVSAANQNLSSTTDFEAYTYDENSNRTSLRKRDTNVINYTFDRLNRVYIKNIPNSTTLDVYSGYDLAGRPLYARFANESTGSGVVYAYDTAKRLTSETSYSRSLTFTYDVASNRTRLTFPDANYIQYDYDALNRVTFIKENGATSGAGVLAENRYNLLSQRTDIIRGNATATNFNSYDLAFRLTSFTQNFSGTTQDLNRSFTYTKASQMLSRTTSNTLFDWSALVENTAYVPDGLNQYQSVAGSAYDYDDNGNLTYSPNLPTVGTRSFGYDVENRLTCVGTGALPCAPATLGLVYDPLGRLYQTTSGGGTVTQFLYDGDRLVAEYNGTSVMQRRYVHGAGVDEPLVWYEGATVTPAARRWLHSDERGSVIAESTDAGVGTLYQYGPYGQPKPSWTGSKFRYTGQIALPEAQLYHYKARVYDPNLGRFLQTDPVGYKDDNNLYAYVGNDPLNHADPTGKFALLLVIPVIEWTISFTATELVVGAVAGTAIAATANAVLSESADVTSDTDSDATSKEPIPGAVDLEDDLAGQEVKGEIEAGGGKVLPGMADKKFDPETGTHDKVAKSREHPGGTKTEVHADRNRQTNKVDSIKIKQEHGASRGQQQHCSKPKECSQ